MDRALERALIKFHIGDLNADYAFGWAFAATGLAAVRVLVDGQPVGEAAHGRPRPDVLQAHPDNPEALESGFVFRFPEGAFKRSISEVALEFELSDGQRIKTEETAVPNPLAFRPPATASPASLPRVPLPSEVLHLLRNLRGDEFPEEPDWTDEQIQGAVDDLILLARRGSRRGEGLFRYLRYLESFRSHAKAVARHFPRFNAAVPVGSKDEVAVASSPDAMLCIANHLYVLKSRGLSGRLLEFGCFKGFSTSCLSFACHELGIGLDVFDSFQGLPPSGSRYYQTGDFAGSFEEVKGNVRKFGRIDGVEFHQGFFSETLPGKKVDPICIWMDVDLVSSSRDVMAILPTLPRESCVFTHESTVDDFSDGTVTPLPESPLGPIADAYAKLDRPVSGRHLLGHTGAIWEPGVAIPVLPYDLLLRLLKAC